MNQRTRMKAIGHTATSIILAGVTSMTTLHTPAQAADAATSLGANAPSKEQVSMPKLVRTIDLSHIGSTVAIRKLSFSPDSRYLAIVVDPELGKTDIVVWDMEKGKPQSHIHCPYQYGILADHELLWSRDGKIISFGAKRQWDPMTGEALPDNPAIGRAARLNKDGTKMLTIVGALGQPSYIHVYDTQTWAVQKLYLDGFAVVTAAWTADDKIVVGTSLTHEMYSKVIDGYQPQRAEDTALRLLDPSGKEPTKTRWFLAKPTGDQKNPFMYSFPPGAIGLSDFSANKIYSAFGISIDGITLAISSFHAVDSYAMAGVNLPGGFGMALSPNGKLLFLRGASFKYGGHAPIMHNIIDTDSGNPLVQFGPIPTGGTGFAISPNGLALAIGLESLVEIFQLQ